MGLRNPCTAAFSIVRNIVLAAVLYEPENRKFSVIAERYPKTFNCIAVVFCLYLAFLVFLIAKIVINTTTTGSFILTARTERIEYQPESIAPPRIPLYNATVHWEEASTEQFDPLASEATASKSLAVPGSGSVQIQGASTLVFSRIGGGDLHIQIKSANPVVVYNDRDEAAATLPPAVELVLKDPAALLGRDISWKYNLDGPLIVGRVPTYGVQQLSGLLIDGEIQMIARQLLSENHYKVDPYKLQLGDEIQFQPENPKTSGLVTFDTARGLQVVAIVEAQSATVKKFRATHIQIRNNLWSKLGKDEELVITWAVLLTVPGMLVFLSRLLAFHALMHVKK
ncbi:hypothetical protein [Desulfobulbus elongatus]|uniref:hypothetical protein n=1 Tax=Desulfobulbus elongatus TaxID=53332 RepID=UPI000482E103|nr:hypothetical protein [Desulfobulbus elongatus]